MKSELVLKCDTCTHYNVCQYKTSLVQSKDYIKMLDLIKNLPDCLSLSIECIYYAKPVTAFKYA